MLAGIAGQVWAQQPQGLYRALQHGALALRWLQCLPGVAHVGEAEPVTQHQHQGICGGLLLRWRHVYLTLPLQSLQQGLGGLGQCGQQGLDLLLQLSVTAQQVVEVAVQKTVSPDLLEQAVQEKPDILHVLHLGTGGEQLGQCLGVLLQQRQHQRFAVRIVVLQIARADAEIRGHLGGGDIGLAKTVEQRQRYLLDALGCSPRWFAGHGSAGFARGCTHGGARDGARCRAFGRGFLCCGAPLCLGAGGGAGFWGGQGRGARQSLFQHGHALRQGLHVTGGGHAQALQRTGDPLFEDGFQLAPLATGLLAQFAGQLLGALARFAGLVLGGCLGFALDGQAFLDQRIHHLAAFLLGTAQRGQASQPHVVGRAFQGVWQGGPRGTARCSTGLGCRFFWHEELQSAMGLHFTRTSLVWVGGCQGHITDNLACTRHLAGCQSCAGRFMIFVTGGAGFIGANFVLDWLASSEEPVLNLDKLTYAGNLDNLASLQGDSRHVFVQGDIGDSALVAQLLTQHRPRVVINFAAESHVDRSIHGPEDFIQTNIVGTFHLLEAVRAYWGGLDAAGQAAFRFLHVSTDEVYGSLAAQEPAFTEAHRYEPNSPYSASKAASDHLVRAYHHTYGLPVLTTNCSNNYGPYHFPEKLIPLMIVNALAGKPLPVYGDGQQIRDWLYVRDHCSAIRCVLASGQIGEVYNVGGWNEKPNIEIVQTLCALLDELRPRADGQSYTTQITYVKDRPGHDRRYAIDARKLERELGWKPTETFETGIRKTVQWYLDHPDWVARVQSGSYRDWVKKQYA